MFTGPRDNDKLRDLSGPHCTMRTTTDVLFSSTVSAKCEQSSNFRLVAFVDFKFVRWSSVCTRVSPLLLKRCNQAAIFRFARTQISPLLRKCSVCWHLYFSYRSQMDLLRKQNCLNFLRRGLASVCFVAQPSCLLTPQKHSNEE